MESTCITCFCIKGCICIINDILAGTLLIFGIFHVFMFPSSCLHVCLFAFCVVAFTRYQKDSLILDIRVLPKLLWCGFPASVESNGGFYDPQPSSQLLGSHHSTQPRHLWWESCFISYSLISFSACCIIWIGILFELLISSPTRSILDMHYACLHNSHCW